MKTPCPREDMNRSESKLKMHFGRRESFIGITTIRGHLGAVNLWIVVCGTRERPCLEVDAGFICVKIRMFCDSEKDKGWRKWRVGEGLRHSKTLIPPPSPLIGIHDIRICH